jgi:biotin carboxyl carrier protein
MHSDAVRCVLLTGPDDQISGAIVLAGTKDAVHGAIAEQHLQQLAPIAGAQLHALRVADFGGLRPWMNQLKQRFGRRYWKCQALAGVLLAILFFPATHRIKCACTSQPVTRRFIAAPYDGKLDRAFVRVGDVVAQNQVLARMDGDEIRLELAAADAALHREIKKGDVARANSDAATAQISELECERLRQQKKLLEYRIEHLEIRSPVAGIVIRGELDNAAGAPVTVGQMMLEISPLSEMMIELEIPEYDCRYVQPCLPVTVRLDAFPRHRFNGEIKAICPRAELRDRQSVFIGEIPIDNEQGQLKPGMRGTATIHGPKRSLVWIWFHRPWEMLLWRLGL